MKSIRYSSKSKARDSKLRWKYGITLDHYLWMAERQNGECAICGYRSINPKAVSSLKTDLVVDHCHLTSRIRGLLCSNCNSGIGFLKENKNILLRAIEYLESGPIELPNFQKEEPLVVETDDSLTGIFKELGLSERYAKDLMS